MSRFNGIMLKKKRHKVTRAFRNAWTLFGFWQQTIAITSNWHWVWKISISSVKITDDNLVNSFSLDKHWLFDTRRTLALFNRIFATASLLDLNHYFDIKIKLEITCISFTNHFSYNTINQFHYWFFFFNLQFFFVCKFFAIISLNYK